MVTSTDIAELLGGRKVLGRRVATTRELDALVSEGMPRSALDALIERLAGDEPQRSRARLRYRIIPRATYQRSQCLNPYYGQTTERLARVYAMVRALWRDESVARRFMTTPHPELSGKTPLETALTEIGGREVEAVIERGKRGLPV